MLDSKSSSLEQMPTTTTQPTQETKQPVSDENHNPFDDDDGGYPF